MLLIDSAKWVHHTTHVTLELEKLLGVLKDAETNQRGYLLTHDSLFLKEYTQALKIFPWHLETLTQLTRDNVVQQQNLVAIKVLSDQRISYMDYLLKSDRQGPLTNLQILGGKTIMDSLQAGIHLMNSVENELYVDRNEVLSEKKIITPIVVLFTSLCALAVLFLSYSGIISELNKSLRFEKELKVLVTDAPSIICMMRGPNHIFELANESYLKLIASREILGKPIRSVLPELEGQGFYELLDNSYATGKTYAPLEVRINLQQPNGETKDFFINFVYVPSVNNNGKVDGILVYGNDVTSQIIERNKIRESEEKLRMALEGGGLGTFDFNPVLQTITWSNRTKEMFGLHHDTDVEYSHYVNGIHPDDRKRSEEIVREMVNSQSKEFYELEYRTIGIHDGITRWVKSKGKITFNNEGQPVRVNGITQETTQRKAFEEQIEKFKYMADNATDSFILVRKDGSFAYLNKIALVRWGYSETESSLLRVPDVDPNFDLHSFRQIFKKAVDGIIIPFETSHRRKDGSLYPVEVNMGVLHLKNEPYLFAIARDITERKKEQEKIKESEERFRQLSEALPQLVWVTDANGISEYTSGKWFDYTGVKPKGAEEWQAIVHPDDIDGINSAWLRSLATGEFYKYDVRLKSISGLYKWFTVTGEPVYDENKKIIKWVGAFNDTHAEKTFLQELNKIVADRTQELLIKNEELEIKNKELESFTFISSHDLQEPLRKIQTFASKILDNEFKNLSDKGKDYFKRMRSAASRMQRLIDDLLDFSRIKAGDRNFEKINLNKIIDEVVNEISDEMDGKNVSLQIEQLINLTIIPFQFKQLLSNLILNSIKFAKATEPSKIKIDGKKVFLNKLSDSVALSSIRERGRMYYNITITDNGIGFDPHYNERIFEVFQRLHSKEEYAGTGIGLAIVKKIVDNHEGFITATGRPGVGASFDIYVPLD